MTYHDTVLLKESIEGLDIKPNGIYVDLTYGGGGHSKAILEQLKNGKLIAFDQDAEAEQNRIKDKRLMFVRHNFRFLKNFLRFYNIDAVQGILADLGVSSHHFNEPERGFSYRFDGLLDMRMNTNAKRTAADILNNYPEIKLRYIFDVYGELENAGRLTRIIIDKRASMEFTRIGEFVETIRPCIPWKTENKYLAKVFQALRIEVNREIENLREMLQQTEEVIEKDGRLVVISYHSLEDRLVKNYMRYGLFEGEPNKDFFGNIIAPFEPVNRKVIVPSDAEIEQNNRARSAKLRVAKRI
jgi:16S rRNA (cytosine1402-N4)-methyltransferase